ncbi:hypothetical protein EON63_15920 [archaeon]|nr:MAG: hypothetical protein EON63_15920 [archaeon]
MLSVPQSGETSRSPEEVAKMKRERKARRKSMRGNLPPEKMAITKWANSLTDRDYDVEHWRVGDD